MFARVNVGGFVKVQYLLSAQHLRISPAL